MGPCQVPNSSLFTSWQLWIRDPLVLGGSSQPGVFLAKFILKVCSKCTGDHPCRRVISMKLQSNFIEITLRHGCSPVNLLHIFRILFTKSTSERLLLATIFFFFFGIFSRIAELISIYEFVALPCDYNSV